MKRLIYYSVFIIFSGSITFVIPGDLFRTLIIFISLNIFLISVFESSNKQEIFLNFRSRKLIKENLSIILERFFKIFIPALLILNILITLFVQLNPDQLKVEKSFLHYEIVFLMLVLLIFSIYSIVNLNSRLTKLYTTEKQLWISNNEISDNRSEHCEKIDNILSLTYKLISRKNPLLSSGRRKSIWVLIPDFDSKNRTEFFNIVHVRCHDSDSNTYAKIMDVPVPFLNIDEWIKACDELYENIKESSNKDFLEKAYLEFARKKNEYSSLTCYIHFRNFQFPIISKIGKENCIVYNDKYLSIFGRDKLERKKAEWKSMVGWNIIYKRKKIGVCFFFDTERYGFRPIHRLVMKFLVNILAPVLYDGIQKGYYGDTAIKMLEGAPDIVTRDKIIEKLSERYRSKDWKQKVKKLERFCKGMKKLGNGY